LADPSGENTSMFIEDSFIVLGLFLKEKFLKHLKQQQHPKHLVKQQHKLSSLQVELLKIYINPRIRTELKKVKTETPTKANVKKKV
jgi:hypothetical protein